MTQRIGSQRKYLPGRCEASRAVDERCRYICSPLDHPFRIVWRYRIVSHPGSANGTPAGFFADLSLRLAEGMPNGSLLLFPGQAECSVHKPASGTFGVVHGKQLSSGSEAGIDGRACLNLWPSHGDGRGHSAGSNPAPKTFGVAHGASS